MAFSVSRFRIISNFKVHCLHSDNTWTEIEINARPFWYRPFSISIPNHFNNISLELKREQWEHGNGQKILVIFISTLEIHKFY